MCENRWRVGLLCYSYASLGEVTIARSLSVFVDHPQTPMDNNLGERLLRDAVIGRRLSFGSDSRTGAHVTALMYSVIGTLNLNGIDVLRWLDAWLAACAEKGDRPPDDLAPWLPWSMEPARRRELTAPG